MSNYTQVERGGLYELTESARAELTSSKYFNVDLAPTSVSQRTWTTYNITALWVAMAICIPSFTMASSLVGLGLSPWVAVFNVTLGNLIVLVPMQLNSHAGTKYGIPFPVFARLTFGAIGAHIPSISRALVACGWNSIQSWIGGGAVAAFVGVFVSSFVNMAPVNVLGAMVDPGQLIGFFVFLLIVLFFSTRGSEGIKLLQSVGAPILVFLCVALMIWSTTLATGAGYAVGDILQASGDNGIVNSNGGFLFVFCGGLTANIAFWATLALNIPDFSRYAKSQKAQFRGQLYGMPTAMFGCAFIGAYFAQATYLAWGVAEFDPTAVLGQLDNAFITLITALSVMVITVTTTIAANVVAPANAFSNLVPGKITFNAGVIITILLSILYRPWWIFGGAGAYIFGWLGTYGTILAPIAAIFVADYYIVKKRTIDVMALFQGPEGRYWYQSGFNVRAIIAWVAAFTLPIIDQFASIFGGWISANGYIFSFVVGLIVYWALMKSEKTSLLSDEDHEAMTEKAAA